MADLVITAANVVSGADAVNVVGTAGATITAGQAVYLDSATNTFKLADADLSAAAAALVGIARHAASSGQPLSVQVAGSITIGATVAIGTVYVLSATGGGIAPAADLVAGMYTGLVGLGNTAAIMTLAIKAGGVAHA